MLQITFIDLKHAKQEAATDLADKKWRTKSIWQFLGMLQKIMEIIVLG